MRVFRSSRSAAKPDLFGFARRWGCSPRLFRKIEELTAKNFKDSSVGCLYRFRSAGGQRCRDTLSNHEIEAEQRQVFELLRQ
jgi:hypothetical protein